MIAKNTNTKPNSTNKCITCRGEGRLLCMGKIFSIFFLYIVCGGKFVVHLCPRYHITLGPKIHKLALRPSSTLYLDLK